jgi:hypothetical protein
LIFLTSITHPLQYTPARFPSLSIPTQRIKEVVPKSSVVDRTTGVRTFFLRRLPHNPGRNHEVRRLQTLPQIENMPHGQYVYPSPSLNPHFLTDIVIPPLWGKKVDPAGMLLKLYQAHIEKFMGNIFYCFDQPFKNGFISRRLR